VLTEKEKSTLETIIKFQTEKGYTPTIRELRDLINVSSSISTIHKYLIRLESNGYIQRGKNVARAIKIIKTREE